MPVASYALDGLCTAPNGPPEDRRTTFDLFLQGTYTPHFMVPLLTADEMQKLDRLAIEEIGIPSLVLMEIAGRGVAEAIRERHGAQASVVIVCGLGNNGGDGVVCARTLVNAGHRVLLLLLGDPERASPDMKKQLEIASKLEIEPTTMSMEEVEEMLGLLLPEFDVAVDAIFGTGLSRDTSGIAAAAIDALNQSSVPVVSVDVPSGVDATSGRVCGNAVEAEITVTFAVPKLGLLTHPGRAHAGEIQVREIGIPLSLLDRIDPRVELVDDTIFEAAIAPRSPDAHKGSFGHLLVIAGSADRPGSALLAGRAALRVGTGLVTIGNDAATIARLAPAFEELMGHSLGETSIERARLEAALERKTAVAIGPSLIANAAMQSWFEPLLDSALPLLLDAGALDALGDPARLTRRSAPTVLTPHPGEMARVIGRSVAEIQADRLGAARQLAARAGAVVVLKGASSLVVDPDGRSGLVAEGNPGMATAGMGDVLTGVIGGLLAQGLPASLAARAGVLLHARAGDQAAEREGETRLVASDLISELARPAPSAASE